LQVGQATQCRVVGGLVNDKLEMSDGYLIGNHLGISFEKLRKAMKIPIGWLIRPS